MMEVNVNVKCPDLLQAVTTLVSALKGQASTQTQTPAPATVSPAPIPAPVQPAPIAPAPIAPAPTNVPSGQAPAAVPAPVAPVPPAGPNPAVSTAPVAPAPSITQAQVSKAGADLIAVDPSKMPQLLALLQQFGVPAITELRPEQLGPFATALRGLGGKI